MEQESLRKREPYWTRFVRFCKQNPPGAIGLAIATFIIALVIFAPIIGRSDPFTTDMVRRLSPPSIEFPFGTDALGRDMLSRVLFGGRLSLYIGLVSTFSGTMLGLALGLMSAYFGGQFDTFLQRGMDILLAFPRVIVALVIMAVLGISTINVIIAISVPLIPQSNRILRSAALSIKEYQYVEAARAGGNKPLRIIFGHILPNCIAPYIVFSTALLGATISVEAALSFLGFGVPPPAPSWGRLISEGMIWTGQAPWLVLFPASILALTVYGINLLGDALRDTLDPRLRMR